LELKDVEHAAGRGVRASIIKEDLQGYIAELGQLDDMRKLSFHDHWATHGTMQQGFIEHRPESQRILVS
jgi:hypothetical protein